MAFRVREGGSLRRWAGAHHQQDDGQQDSSVDHGQSGERRFPADRSQRGGQRGHYDQLANGVTGHGNAGGSAPVVG